jgi:REP element-mobilizing transposase RayT
MPGHIHLVISESERSTPSTVMQVVKQRYARHLLHKKRRKPVDAGSDSVLGILWLPLARQSQPDYVRP